MDDKDYMKRALERAKKGEGFVSPNPMVGAVIVKDGEIIAEGWHEKYGDLHAERNALKHCTQSAEGADMYVTLEPCTMCAAAISFARIKNLYFGAFDSKGGAVVNGVKFYEQNTCHHRPHVISGILESECADILKKFFKAKRTKN